MDLKTSGDDIQPRQEGVTLTWAQLLAAASLLCVALFAIFTFIFGNVRDDMDDVKTDLKEIRGKLDEFTKADFATEDQVTDISGDLRKAIVETNTTVIRIDAKLDGLTEDVRTMQGDIGQIRDAVLK